jgi:phage shock protein B
MSMIGLMMMVVGCGAVLALLALPIWLVFRLARRSGGGAEAEELRLVQDVHAQMARLEERVEALETILLDRARESPKR